jgi:RNA polymerase sigma-70 factor (ECF subfamily)
MEAMQDVFVEVLRRQGRLTVAAPSSFLYTTATHVCLNQIRSATRKPSHPRGALIEHIAHAPDAEDRALASSVLDRIFRREAHSTRVMAVLFLVDGLTLEEVSAEVGLSVSGVRKRLRKLRGHVTALEAA